MKSCIYTKLKVEVEHDAPLDEDQLFEHYHSCLDFSSNRGEPASAGFRVLAVDVIEEEPLCVKYVMQELTE